MGIRISECIALSYFLYLVTMALIVRVPRDRKRHVIALALLAVALMPALAAENHPLAAIARDWMPGVYLLLGYWLPAHLAGTPNLRFEQKLLEVDRTLFGANTFSIFSTRAPRLVLELFELAYLFCYPLVPIGFGWLLFAGFRHQADQFWTTVLLASFACYGLLPWIPTRAPRAIERADPRPSISRIRMLNLMILDLASVQLNTFPSGHTAAALATALAVGTHSFAAGIVLGFIAVCIAIGSVVGRYHYAADAITGAIVAAAAFVVSRIVRT
jgi:membrane-associated phospholipid phosphatase